MWRLFGAAEAFEKKLLASNRGVAVVLVGPAVRLVGAALQHHVDGSAAGEPLFGIVGVGRDIDVLDGFDGWPDWALVFQGLMALIPSMRTVRLRFPCR